MLRVDQGDADIEKIRRQSLCQVREEVIKKEMGVFDVNPKEINYDSGIREGWDTVGVY